MSLNLKSNPILTLNLKNRCKLLINGVKIASTHSKNKKETKRQLCMKAFGVLSKIFPIVKVI